MFKYHKASGNWKFVIFSCILNIRQNLSGVVLQILNPETPPPHPPTWKISISKPDLFLYSLHIYPIASLQSPFAYLKSVSKRHIQNETSILSPTQSPDSP